MFRLNVESLHCRLCTRELDVRSNALSGTIPSQLFTYTSLTALYLQDNAFTGALPSAQLAAVTWFMCVDVTVPSVQLTAVFITCCLRHPLFAALLVFRYVNTLGNRLVGDVPTTLTGTAMYM